MKAEDPLLTGIALDFFGKTAASISHEIKNALAIIKESAGLMGDLMFAAQKSQPLQPERLARVAATLNRQVERTDAIVKNLNRFGHSVDMPIQPVDVNDTVRLAAAIAARPVKMQGVAIAPADPKETVVVITKPFFLLNLVWRAIHLAAGMVADKKVIGLAVEKDGQGAKIMISGLTDLTHVTADIFTAAEEKALANLLKIDIQVLADINRVHLILPPDMSE